uniref:Mos1 transposase HTH domain-containing protein n=1 Tax=Clastoptera arizonana TaxID=38151 RepID=A0A1B6D8M0_9HEMI
MQRSLDQRYSIKFCVKLNKTSTETIGLLKEAYGDQSLSSAQVKRWHKSFKDGREDVEDEQRSGRPSTTQTDEDVNRVREFLNIDRRASLREISEELNLTYYNVREIVTSKLKKRKVCAKLVPPRLALHLRTGQDGASGASPPSLQPLYSGNSEDVDDICTKFEDNICTKVEDNICTKVDDNICTKVSF